MKKTKFNMIMIQLLVYLSGAVFCFAQDISSSVTGIVRDVTTRKAVEGVAVTITLKDQSQSTVTDSQGRFNFEKLAPGRYRCTAQSLGYETMEEEVLVISGKMSVINFDLTESVTELTEVTVQARPNNNTSTGTITLPIEKVMRMPANFFDPVRMLTSYPGIVAANDQANNIIVKGNSPNGLLWRLNGMDIVNPNHLANAGSFTDKPTAVGGGVNILSAQMLDRTEFYSGNMPTRYGNFTSGVLDMALRSGNATRHEFTAQASLIGLDFAAEGPLGKKGRSSYLVNYRYSTVGLLSAMGVNFGDEKISFTDLSAHIKTKVGEQGNLSFYAVGGLSKNIHDPLADTTLWEKDKDRSDIRYKGNMGAIGTRYDQGLGDRLVLSMGATLSGNLQDRQSATVPSKRFPTRTSQLTDERTLLSTFVNLSGKISEYFSIEAGTMLNHYRDSYVVAGNEWYDPVGPNAQLFPNALIAQSTPATSFLVQPYGQLSYRRGRLGIDAGVRYAMSSLSKDQSLDPRGNVTFRMTSNSSISINGGRSSQMMPAAVYLTNIYNRYLGFMRKTYGEIGYALQGARWKWNATAYYQHYSDVPVYLNSFYSIVNAFDGTVPNVPFVPVGTGTNKGVTLQAERPFDNGYYILASGSVYRSLYKGGDDIERPTRFDGRYSMQITGGKEWTKETETAKKAFSIHARLMYMGGLRETPIDLTTSREKGYTIFSSQTNDNILKDYFRPDLRISWRKDNKRYTRTVSIDIQNVAGIQNEAYRFYDMTKNDVVVAYQVGIIPVVVYRIDF